MLREAKAKQGDEGEALEHFGREYQKEWRCPFAGFKEPKIADKRRLTKACQHAIEGVEQLIGAPPNSFATCPSYYARTPDVAEAINARWHAEHGGLADYMPNAPQAIYDAIALINGAVNERNSREFEIRQRKLDDAARRNRPNNPPTSQ